MKLDTSGIDQEQLAHFVDAAYALDIVALSFQPKGEASYSYLATERSGARWLIKVQETARLVELELRLRAVRFVHAAGGLTQVVVPRHTRWGECTCRFAHYTVTVYPFIEGDTLEPGRQTDAYVSRLAALLAAFHAQGSRLPFPIPRETFDNPFEAPILHALRIVQRRGQPDNPVKARLRDLLLAQRADIFTTLEKMRQLKGAVRNLDLDWVLTHGDPTWANVLVDRSNTFHLLDWDDLALGPAERDLVFASDWGPERFEAFLRQYMVSRGPVRLHPQVFAFYQYRWIVQEIADYTTRILFRNVDPAEDAHAWAELQPYVPAYHADIAAGVRQVEEILGHLAKG